MDNKIEVFKNEQFGEVRTILDGETLLFCGSDVARALGYARPGKAIIDHCKGVLKRDTLTSGGTQSLSYITEGDVYRLIVHSKLPSAERFEHWLFDEVVPMIRKTGCYMTESLLDRIQKEPAVIIELAQTLLKETNRANALDAELGIRDQQNALITSLNLKLSGVSKKRTRLYEDFTEGILDEEEYAFAKKAYDEQYADLSRRLDEAVQRKVKFAEAMSEDNKWLTLMKSVSGAEKLSQELVDESVELVKVHEGGSIELVMKYGDIYALTVQSIKEVQEAM